MCDAGLGGGHGAGDVRRPAQRAHGLSADLFLGSAQSFRCLLPRPHFTGVKTEMALRGQAWRAGQPSSPRGRVAKCLPVQRHSLHCVEILGLELHVLLGGSGVHGHPHPGAAILALCRLLPGNARVPREAGG